MPQNTLCWLPFSQRLVGSTPVWTSLSGGPSLLYRPLCAPPPPPRHPPLRPFTKQRGGGEEREPYPEEGRFDFSAVLPGLLVHDGVEDVLGGDAGVRHPLVVAHHPDEDVWDTVLRLRGKTSGG